MSFALSRFPIEILHMIFEYFWAHEILNTFYNINDYFNRILHDYDHYMINFRSVHKSQFDLVCRLIRPEQVISLTLADEKETPCQSQLFLSLFPIKTFTRLRTLKLFELTDDGQRLLSKLYKVHNLASLEINIQIDLPVIHSLPPIRNLVINMPSGIQMDIRQSIGTISLEHVRHLSVSFCTVGAFLHIFKEIPRLKSFKTSLLFFKPLEIQIFTYIHQIQTTPVDLVSLSLSINAPCQRLTHNHFELFLAPLRRLKHLELIIDSGLDRVFFKARQWENLVTEYLPKLTTFNFKFRTSSIRPRTINEFRSSFWLERNWFVAFDQQEQSFFTVPHFISTTATSTTAPLSSVWTTLPQEQQISFYDCVTIFQYQSNQLNFSGHYNYFKELTVECPYMIDNRINLSRVKSLTINTSDWPLNRIVTLIKESMPSVSYLRLIGAQEKLRYQHFAEISLPQIQRLSLPSFGQCKENLHFDWLKIFPCVKNLIASIISTKQIIFLIDHFETTLNYFFVMNDFLVNQFDRIKITRPWLKKHVSRLKSRKDDDFVCEINNKYGFSLCLWMSDNENINKK